jgi:phosphatidylglycerophosphate synthase
MARRLASVLDRMTGSRVTPNAVTLAGLAAHVPAALLIASGHHLWAALVFALAITSDAVDGELARIQRRASVGGMLLDATADRIEEVLIYCGICYFLSTHGSPSTAVWAVAACGSGLCVSYVKAKAEVAVATQLAGTGASIDHDVLNQMFQVGVAGLKIRRQLLLVGLLLGLLVPVLVLLTVLAVLTFWQRWNAITTALGSLPGRPSGRAGQTGGE